jgi:tetratricopeptide (TPR) repeat protein
MMQFMAERFLYLPMMGFLLALAGVFVNFSRPRAVALVAVGVVAAWTAVSAQRMGIWKDGLMLFVRTEFEHPGIKRVEQNAVAAIYGLPWMEPLFPDYRKTGSVRMADTLTPEQGQAILQTLEGARGLFPENAMLTTDLGFVEAKMGRWPEAVALVELAVLQKPDSAQYWLNLGSMYLATGQPAKAQKACAESLRLKPDFEEARKLEGRIEQRLNGN